MQIKQEEQTAGGRFVAVENGVEIGHLDYEWDDKQCFGITHTVVEKPLKGVALHVHCLMRPWLLLDMKRRKSAPFVRMWLFSLPVTAAMMT